MYITVIGNTILLLLLATNAIIYLFERARSDDVVHPLHTESAAQLDHLHVALPGASERREEETHGQSVVYVPQSVDERRIPVRIITAVICGSCRK